MRFTLQIERVTRSIRTMVVLHVLGVLAAFNVVYLTLQVAALRVCAIECDEIVFGLGPRLFILPIGDARVVVKAVPVASSVVPRGVPAGMFHDESVAVRCAVHAGPWIALLASIAAFAGIEPTTRWVASAVPQVASAVFPTFGGGAPLIGRFETMLTLQPVVTVLAVSAKLCAFNLLPLPSLPGGRLVMDLVTRADRAKHLAATLSYVLVLFVVAGWAWSMVRYLQ